MKRKVICQSLRNGKRTSSQIVCVLEPSKKNIFQSGPVLSFLTKINSSLLQKGFRKNCCRFLEGLVSTISTVASPSPVVQRLSSFAQKSSLEVITIQLLTSSGKYYMGYMSLAGLRGQKLSLSSVLGRISTKLVLWCFKIISVF